MEKSINESEDQDDYISLKISIILIKMWSPMALIVDRKMRKDPTEKRKFLSNINTEFWENMCTCGRQCWKVMGTR